MKVDTRCMPCPVVKSEEHTCGRPFYLVGHLHLTVIGKCSFHSLLTFVEKNNLLQGSLQCCGLARTQSCVSRFHDLSRALYTSWQLISPQLLKQGMSNYELQQALVPREIENNAYAKFWRDNEEYYGIFEKGLDLVTVFDAIVSLMQGNLRAVTKHHTSVTLQRLFHFFFSTFDMGKQHWKERLNISKTDKFKSDTS